SLACSWVVTPTRAATESRLPSASAAGSDDAAVIGHGLEKTFAEVTAVDGVDIRVDREEIYGFLGPNGAGKSTLVRMLCTLMRPTAGTAAVAGFDVVTHPQAVRLRIGVALQDAGLDNNQSGRELLRLQGRLYGLRTHEIDIRLAQILGMVDIGDAIDRRIGTYSGGMKRRLDLAASLVHNPQVLFLDEPTTGLDPASRALVWHEVRRLNSELGMTIFLTTQYLEEADQLADRVGIISQGRIVAEGPPSELKRSIGDDVIVAEIEGEDPGVGTRLEQVPGVHHVHIDGHEISVRAGDGAATISPVAVALSDSHGGGNLRVKSLTLRTPTLDDVFLELTGGHIETNEDQ
ncbi:MAG: ATP-binding cassette domain-containing protein, partial [Acidimicrobiales bacterium]